MRRALTLWLVLAAVPQTGCSVFSPVPLWELAKATGGLASTALSFVPPRASDTVFHEQPTISALCIEYNAEAQAADVLSALQAELRGHGIQSRIYEAGTPAATCGVWLRYTVAIQWEQAPFAAGYKSFVQEATLTLRAADGRVLSSSRYVLDSPFDIGKWAPTRSKLAPVVTALVTGFEN